jgi:glycosyltransferase involved in cell wall biosynthesis
MSDPLFTVVICTYNRAKLLAGALETVCAQTLEASRYEVLVVDNNSTDETATVVAEAGRGDTVVRYVFEPRQGLSFARNCGYRAARGEYVAYLDDDCKVPPGWLATAEQVIASARHAIFGGPYFAFYDTAKPKWFRDEYGSHVQGEISRALTDQEYLDGANMFIRRALLRDQGGFSPEFGMTGRGLGYGEEVRFQRRLREMHPDVSIYYEPRLYVYHLVSPQKMTLGWKLRQMFVIGRDWHRVIHDGTQSFMTGRDLLLEAVRTLKAFCVDVVRGIFRRDRERYQFLQNYLYEHAFVSIHQLGQLHEQFVGRMAARKGRT